MGALATIKWEGQSGRKYKYWVYKIGTRFKDTPANYVLARETAELTFAPVHVGQTEDLCQQFGESDDVARIREGGATHIHVHANSLGEAARLGEEADLRSLWGPVCQN